MPFLSYTSIQHHEILQTGRKFPDQFDADFFLLCPTAKACGIFSHGGLPYKMFKIRITEFYCKGLRIALIRWPFYKYLRMQKGVLIEIVPTLASTKI